MLIPLNAGPPFNTDDPEPVEYKHWEYYISSINTFETNNFSGTLPHFEVNYGLVPDVQVHFLAPLNYNYSNKPASSFKYEYATTELGFKYRFVHETDNLPQIGIFPLIEVPTIHSSDFENYTKIYLPIWIQKSYGNFCTYGGGGYWININSESKNQLYLGWLAQYDFSKHLTLGGEVFHLSPEFAGTKSLNAINLGGFINVTENLHFLFSVGRSLDNSNVYIGYFGILYTI